MLLDLEVFLLKEGNFSVLIHWKLFSFFLLFILNFILNNEIMIFTNFDLVKLIIIIKSKVMKLTHFWNYFNRIN